MVDKPLQTFGQTTVLIPAAGRVPEGLLALSNIQNPAMIPVAGRPVIHWTMSYLRSLGLTRFVIAVSGRGGFIEDFVDCAFGATCHVDFIVPPKGGGLGNTVRELSHHVKTPRALVVLGDTHFQFVDPAAVLESRAPTVLVSRVSESYRWCIAESGADGLVTALRDKEPGLSGPLDALIGVYSFPHAPGLVAAADAAVAQAEKAGRPAEMKAILDEVREQQPLRAAPAGDWLDCGNPDRQAAAHQALLQKRAFNELSIDPVLGTITKKSRHVEKFIDEINYLRALPTELSVLFPRVLDYSVAPEAPMVKLEYYGYPTLADAFVFENVDPGVWQRIFEHLKTIIQKGFLAHPQALPHGALAEMLIGKTRARLNKLTGPDELVRLVTHEGSLTINGRQVKNLPLLWSRIEAEVDRLSSNAQGSVMHGDLCFSNVLYDLRSRICKFVDPRGSFGQPGIAGDVRYDIAKLYHSVRGRYDLLTNDLFHLKIDGLSIDLELRSLPNHAAILERFERVFFAPDGFHQKDVLLMTAMLFASMPPLHYDYPKRQVAMYATALRLLDEALS